MVPGQTAEDREAGGVEQTAEVMARLQALLHEVHEVHASLSDVVKKEEYYDGTDLADWAEMAAVRARHFAGPGPVATVVPWHSGWPRGARTQVEVLAMREERNGFDKYIPAATRGRAGCGTGLSRFPTGRGSGSGRPSGSGTSSVGVRDEHR